jgi:PAS domain S-box-containing protein
MAPEPSPKILILDVEPGSRSTLGEALQGTEATLVHASSDAGALERLAQEEHALVLLDAQAPGLDAFGTARVIRERSRHTPILLVTTPEAGETSLFSDCPCSGIDYLLKPVIPEMLRARVGSLLQLHVERQKRVRAEAALDMALAERDRAETEQARLRRKAEAAEAWLKTVTDGLPAFISYIDAGQRLRFANSFYYGWFDLTPEQIEGKHLREIFGEEVYESRLPHVEAALRGEPQHFESPTRRHDGEARATEVFYVPDARDGCVLGFFVLAQDITERKQPEEALRQGEERLRLALNAGKCGTWEWEIPDNRITWSERIYEFHGLPPGSFSGKVEDFARLIHPKDSDRVSKALAAALDDGAPYEVEFRAVRPCGDVRWLSTSARVICDADGKPLRMLGATIDTTDRKRLEEELRRRAEELTQADRRKDEFLAMLSHELRNPLAPILNAVTIMRARPDRERGERAREIIDRQTRHLARLVDDLLEVSRIRQGKIDLCREEVEVAAVFEQSLAISRPLLEQRRHDLYVSLPLEPIFLEADPVRLAQVIVNLLNNAAKYTDEGGRIWLGARRQSSEVIISVRDSGRGISAQMLSHVFDLFVQGERTLARSEGGLGIGLTLVKRLVELHGGTVGVHSDGPGQGSEFLVRLPAGAPGSPASDDRPGGSGPARSLFGRRVLVVEDNRDAAETVAELLALWGHDVRIIPDGSTAVETALAYDPDVVLLDIGLPGIDGYEVARRLRARRELAQSLIIALTGYGQAEDRERAREAGFDYHLVKPVDPDALRDLLSRAPARLVERVQEGASSHAGLP